jgi:hypothetical protein
VIDDVRFPSDARFVAKGSDVHRGAVLKIVATDVPPPAHAGHASESAVDEVRPQDVAATLLSSRALGVRHMLIEVDHLLGAPGPFDVIRPALATMSAQSAISLGGRQP